MKLELVYEGDVTIRAVDSYTGRECASATGPTLQDAVQSLVSRFAELQRETIDALNASGLIRYIPGEDSEHVS